MSVIDDGRVGWVVGDMNRPARSAGRRRLHVLARQAAALPRSALYLVPLRIFIGIGWVRAGVEKVVDPSWWDGAVLQRFLSEELQAGRALAPFRPLMAGALDDAAVTVAGFVAVAQLLIGVCIVLGWRTTPALFVGVVMNVAFVLAGRTNPNVFYLLVQWALLVGGAGCLMGLDARRLACSDALQLNWSPFTWAVAAVAAVLVAIGLVPFAGEFAPARVVEDPALVLITMALLVAGTATLAGLRAVARQLPPAS